MKFSQIKPQQGYTLVELILAIVGIAWIVTIFCVIGHFVIKYW